MKTYLITKFISYLFKSIIIIPRLFCAPHTHRTH